MFLAKSSLPSILIFLLGTAVSAQCPSLSASAALSIPWNCHGRHRIVGLAFAGGAQRPQPSPQRSGSRKPGLPSVLVTEMKKDVATNEDNEKENFLSKQLAGFWVNTDSVLRVNNLDSVRLNGASKTSRRAALKALVLFPFLFSDPAAAKGIQPDAAFASLLKSREELIDAGNTYVPKKNWDGFRTYLSDERSSINNYEANAGALLASKRLDAESKKEIGTIRRYGVGADVIIMYGGLKAELDEENEEPNSAVVQKFLRKTLDSLDEVIAICRSNGF